MIFSPTSSFYVTSMSHAATCEFPHNRFSHFRNRLPICGKTIPVVGEQFVNEKDPLLYVRWHEWVYGKDDQDNDRWWHERRELKILGEDMKESLSSSTGYQFFQKLIHRYDQERASRTKPKNKWAEDDGTKLYPSFEWTSQGDLLLNTANVDYRGQVARVF